MARSRIIGLGIGVCVGISVCVGVDVGMGVCVGSRVAVCVGATVEVGAGVFVCVGIGSSVAELQATRVKSNNMAIIFARIKPVLFSGCREVVGIWHIVHLPSFVTISIHQEVSTRGQDHRNPRGRMNHSFAGEIEKPWGLKIMSLRQPLFPSKTRVVFFTQLSGEAAAYWL